MPVLTVGTVPMPAPASLTVSYEEPLLTVRRTLDGTAHCGGAGLKRVISCVWSYLTPAAIRLLFEATASAAFPLTFPDPATGGTLAVTCYCSSRQAGLFKGGEVPVFTDVRLTFREV